MAYIAKRDSSNDEVRRHVDEQLDEALEETFPASDPIAIDSRSVKRVRPPAR